MTTALLVSASARPGGAERAFLDLARNLPRAGVEPVTALLEDGPLAEWLGAAGLEPVVAAAPGRTREPHRLAAAVTRLARLARRSGADVILGSTSKGHLYAGLAALLLRRPEIWWQQAIPGRTRFDLAGARVPSAVVACVGEEAVRAQRRLTPKRDVRAIRLGIPLDDVRARRGTGAALRAELGWAGAPVVGIVGRLEPWKGQRTFLEAAALLAATHPEARFAVVGGAVLGWEGDYPAELERLAAEVGLGERVHFAGHQPDPWRWMDMLDVVVHASFAEPFGLVVLEAMALEKAVVASAQGGPTQVIEHGVSGLLIEPGDAELLAASVARLLDDPALRERLGAAASMRANGYDATRMAREFAALIGELVPAGRRAR